LAPGAASTLVVGLGKTGLSCIRYLARHGLAFEVVDTRAEPPGLAALRAECPDVTPGLGPLNPERLRRAGCVLLSPGVSLREPAVAEALAHGVPVFGDIELFARVARAPVAAITGSNGKSTVTTLLGEMMRDQGRDVRVGGNLGTPALDLLGEAEPELYVLELSSFQLETTASLDAAVATVLNVSPDHMDRHASLGEYAAAKARIFRGTGTMVLNRDDPWVVGMATVGRPVIGFTLGRPAAEDFGLVEVRGEPWLARGTEPLIPESALGIRGRHNTANALAALALGHALEASLAGMLDTLRRFPGLPHRAQWVANADGIDWYNDSKGTNVGATIAAVQGLRPRGQVVLIAGGDGKGADFSPLREALPGPVRGVILIGRDGPRIAGALAGALPVVFAPDMSGAVAEARRLAEPGDAVLLSPACASFDMFRNYEARGDAFVAAVRRELGQ
jgi:UDP-N-acetylmuramoylalanine--D-glutamate ligase